MYAGPTKAITVWYSTRVRLGDVELSFAEEFRYLGHVMTADCRDHKDIKKQFRSKMQLAICWSGSSHLHLRSQKSSFSSHIVSQLMDVPSGVIHARTVLKKSVSHSDSYF